MEKQELKKNKILRKPLKWRRQVPNCSGKMKDFKCKIEDLSSDWIDQGRAGKNGENKTSVVWRGNLESWSCRCGNMIKFWWAISDYTSYQAIICISIMYTYLYILYMYVYMYLYIPWALYAHEHTLLHALQFSNSISTTATLRGHKFQINMAPNLASRAEIPPKRYTYKPCGWALIIIQLYTLLHKKGKLYDGGSQIWMLMSLGMIRVHCLAISTRIGLNMLNEWFVKSRFQGSGWPSSREEQQEKPCFQTLG